jgi:hypothetical protein
LEAGICIYLISSEKGFALWIDANLEKGYSNQSSTFGNQPLASSSNFLICGLELWVIEI